MAVLATFWLLWPRGDNTAVDSGASSPTAAIPAAEALRITCFRVQHLRIVNQLAEDHGEIGKDSFELRFGDSVRMDVKLSRPGYLYLVAFNADGKEQLLWPAGVSPPHGGDPWTIPPLMKYLHFPPNNPRTGNMMGLTLNDEKAGGLQAIALMVSAAPLPPYADYQAARGRVKWEKQKQTKGVWLADTESVYQARRGVGIVRGKPVNRSDTAHLLRFARQLKAGGVELVEVLAFPVLAQQSK
jgi:hypothetical protein